MRDEQNCDKAEPEQENYKTTSNSYVDRLISRRNHHEREFHKLSRLIEMINQNPIINEFMKLNNN